MRRMMQAVGQKLPESTPYFELNPDHPLIARLKQQPEGERFADLVEILFDQARLANGEQLAEPGRYSARLNRLLSDLLG
jgi:molecular chaperone HtpG